MSEIPVTDQVPARAAQPGRTRLRWFRARSEVAWLFLLALAVRAAAAYATPTILPDSVTLLRSAALFGRDGLSAALAIKDHPLTPWIVSLLPSRFDPETAATALCAFAGAIAVWPLHVLARRACGRHAATAACIVYAALPKAVAVASVPLTSALFLPLFLSGLSLVVVAGLHSSNGRTVVRLVSSGAMCGLSYLCRPEGLAVAAGAALAAAFAVRKGRRLAAAAVVAASFALVAAPYAVALSRDAGRVVLSPKKDVAKFVGVADAPTRSAELTSADAVHDVADTLQNTLTAPVFILVLCGAFLPTRWRRNGPAKARTTLLLCAAGLLALVVRLKIGWSYESSRHLLPGALLLLPFAGEGLLFVGAFISRVRARRRLAVALASFFAVACAVKAVLRPVGESLADARRLGEAIARTAEERGATQTVIAGFGRALVAYYADRTMRARRGAARDVPLLASFGKLLDERPGVAPTDAAPMRAELAAALRREGAQWLVLDVCPRGAADQTAAAEKRLAQGLIDDGVLDEHVVAAGGSLAAFPVR